MPTAGHTVSVHLYLFTAFIDAKTRNNAFKFHNLTNLVWLRIESTTGASQFTEVTQILFEKGQNILNVYFLNANKHLN